MSDKRKRTSLLNQELERRAHARKERAALAPNGGEPVLADGEPVFVDGEPVMLGAKSTRPTPQRPDPRRQYTQGEFNQALGRLESLAGTIDALVGSLARTCGDFHAARATVLNSGRILGLDPATAGVILRQPTAAVERAVGNAGQKTVTELTRTARANLQSQVSLHEQAAERRAS